MKRIEKLFSPIFIFTVIFIFSAQTGFSLIARSGDSIEISEDEVIGEDLYIAGKMVSIRGRINGDVCVAGKTVTLNGHVHGNAVIFAETIMVQGEVENGVKAFGNSITIGGKVYGDLLLAGNTIQIEDTSQVGGDLLFAARRIKINAPVEGDILGGGQTVVLNSIVNGDTKLGVKNLTLTSLARVGGNLTYISEEEAFIEPGAEIGGTITRRLPEIKEKLKAIFPFVIIIGIVGKIVGFMMALLVGLVLILVAPRWMQSVTDFLAEKPGPCAGWGALLLFATPIAIFIALVTIVGFTLGVIVGLLYLITLYISQLAVGFLIGRLIIGRTKSVKNWGVMFGVFTLGLFILRIVRLIPVFGHIIWTAAALFGLGAILISEIDRLKTVQKLKT